MAIETTDFVIGLFSVIIVAFNTFTGLTIASKYFKYKRRIFLLMGFAWVLLACPWWPSSTSFILALMTGNGLPVQQYILIGNVCMPIITVFLAVAYADLKYQKNVKTVAIIMIISIIPFEIYLVYFIIFDVSQLGILHGIVDIEYVGFLRYYMIGQVILGVTIGILIAIGNMRSDDPEVRWKGLFLLLAFLLFPLGALTDAILPLTVITVIIFRCVMVLSSILFYFAFLLPNWLKKLLIKEE